MDAVADLLRLYPELEGLLRLSLAGFVALLVGLTTAAGIWAVAAVGMATGRQGRRP